MRIFRKSIQTRVRWAFLGVVFLAALILVRMLDVQWVNGEKWEEVARENGLKFRRVSASRGNVLSDDGSLMATSLPFYQMAMDMTIPTDTLFFSHVDTLSFLLADFFQDKTREEYKAELLEARESKKRFKILSKNLIRYHQRAELEQWPLVREGRYKGGVIFQQEDKRFLPFDQLARRVIGFTLEDSSRQKFGVGLEYSFDSKLGGINGEALYQKMPGGDWKPLNAAGNVRPEHGLDIQTTINIPVQEFAARTMKNALQRHAANYGTLVVMEVQTGEIKAMVNLSRDVNGEYVEDYNYAIGPQGTTEPGSTFKLASFMALLEESNISIYDTVNTHNGRFEFYDECVMTDPVAYGYGKIPVKSVFEKSSNIGTSRLTFLHFNDKPQKFLDYLDRFGLSQPLGFQLLGEGTPYVNKPGELGWSGCSLPWMSIGYELKISPLQLLNFYNAVANNGQLIMPIIVKEIQRDHLPMEQFHTRVINQQICSPKTLSVVKELLEGVVERGTARMIKTDEYKIAGKTGTAHKIQNGRYVNSYYSSFVGYFPADNPRYSMIVAIDDPKSGVHYGGDVAAPVFREVADRLFLEIDSKLPETVPTEEQTYPLLRAGHVEDLNLICSTFGLEDVNLNTSKWVRADIGGGKIQWRDNNGGGNTIPDVRGMTMRDALYVLENQGLRVISRGKGRVVTQSLSPGSRARRGGVIYISLNGR